MLSSLNTHEHQQDTHPGHRQRHSTTTQLLLSCAEVVHHADFAAAHRLLSLLSSASSPLGDSSDRVAHQFTQALSLRLAHLSLLPPSSAIPSNLPPPPPPDRAALQSSYLSLNQITPFPRFAHLTANQAILDAAAGHRSLHVVDFDTAHGLQWPPLMQAIAERSDPPSLRITGAGRDLDILRLTGDRLRSFADGLGLRFRFDILPSLDHPVEVHTGEVLAVNCVHFMHKLLRDDDVDTELRAFLGSVKAMRPAVVTLAEREASHNSPKFLHRFKEAVEHYSSLFESLEATVPPGSRERASVEQIWLGREISDVVAGEGEGRKERHVRFEQWENLMTGLGFVAVPLSPFAYSQAKLLLRLHYPSEGYQLQMVKDTLFLGWKNRSLFSVSSWK